MKFREYVGEDKIKNVKKKIVQTNLGPTDEDFLKNVLRERPDGSKIRKDSKSDINFYLNFGISKFRLKRVFDYIKSWFIRYHVDYKPINPYLTLFVINNVPHTSYFLGKIKNTKSEAIYKPKGTITVIGSNEREFPRSYDIEPKKGKDYILLDYNSNNYSKTLEEIFFYSGIDIVYNQCYVKLFEIKSGIFNHRMYEDMMYSCPEIPDLKLGNVSLKRSC